MKPVLKRIDPKKFHHQFELISHDDEGQSGVEAWILVKDPMRDSALNIHIHRTDEGVVVDIWGHESDDEPLASTYAFFSEAILK